MSSVFDVGELRDTSWMSSGYLWWCFRDWMSSGFVVCEFGIHRGVSPVTAMVAKPLNAAIEIHQWCEQNPSSLLIMAERQRLLVVTLWLATTRHWILRKTFVVSEGKGAKKEPNQVAEEILSFFTRKNFNIN
ncbi:Uncharacterized protein Rs2_26034 [Raphanus sativus]|nr:Uncharacterized protein Rs2_26034 [Raphanus sativus]